MAPRQKLVGLPFSESSGLSATELFVVVHLMALPSVLDSHAQNYQGDLEKSFASAVRPWAQLMVQRQGLVAVKWD